MTYYIVMAKSGGVCICMYICRCIDFLSRTIYDEDINYI